MPKKALTIPDTLLRPVGNARITQKFGVKSVTGIIHKGIDYSVVTGTDCWVCDDGEVYHCEIGKDMPGLESDGSSGGYGTQIRVEHAWGTSFYAHLSVISVMEGMHVSRGEIIGKTGSTGISDGPHLHFQINDSNDVPTDPEPHFGDVEDTDMLPDNFEELWPYIQAVAVAAKRGDFTASEDTPSSSDAESRAIRRLGELFAAVQLEQSSVDTLPPALRDLVRALSNSGLTGDGN